MTQFLPKQYKPQPATSNYFRYEDGENNIRVLGNAITGFEYFNKDNKPVRSKDQFEETPTDIKVGGKVKEFWAFLVWNYNLEKIQIMEVTQKTIMSALLALIDNPKWGDIKTFDITITKKGEGMDTEYNTVPNPHTETPELATKQLSNLTVELDNLYLGTDPFAK